MRAGDNGTSRLPARRLFDVAGAALVFEHLYRAGPAPGAGEAPGGVSTVLTLGNIPWRIWAQWALNRPPLPLPPRRLFGAAVHESPYWTLTAVRAALGRLSALSVLLWKSILYGAVVWARRALEHQKRLSPAPPGSRARTSRSATCTSTTAAPAPTATVRPGRGVVLHTAPTFAAVHRDSLHTLYSTERGAAE